MPPVAALAVAALSAAASLGTAAALTGATIFGVTIGSVGASLIGGVVGAIVAGVGSILMGALINPSRGGASPQNRSQTIRSAVAPRQVVYGRVLVSGPVLYVGSSGADKQYFNIVIAVAGHAVDGFDEVHLNDKVITLVSPGSGGLDGTDRAGGALSGKVLIHTYDGTQTTADSRLISESSGEWTSSHILYGVAYIYLRVEYDSNLFPSGFQSVAAVVRGRKLYDPRDGSTAYSTNCALAVRDYLTASYGLSATSDEIDDTFAIAAANACDETVYLDLGGTIPQKRYEINGAFTLDQTPAQIVESLLSSCGGTLVYVQGAYRINVAHYDSPSWSLGPSDFAGDISVVTQISRRELMNTVSGTYIEPSQNWTEVSFPAVSISWAVTADGQTLVQDTRFAFTNDVKMVQRLARIQLLRGRYPIRIEAPLKYAQIRMACWDSVAITLPDFGWSSKVFKLWGWKFDPVSGLINVTLQEDYASIYSWTALDAADPAAPAVPSIVDPLTIDAPTGLVVTAGVSINGDGGAQPALFLHWNAVAHPFVTSYEIQWKASGASVWQAFQIPAPGTYAIIQPVTSGSTYYVRVRAVAGLVRGGWETSGLVTALQDSTPPGDPTGLMAGPAPGAIALSWYLPSDDDLAAIEVWTNTTSSPVGRVYLAETSGSGFRHANLSGGTVVYYWVRARDRTGNLGNFVGPVNATAGTLTTTDLATNSISTGATAFNDTVVTITDTPGSYTDVVSVTVTVPANSMVVVLVDGQLSQDGATAIDSWGGPG